MQRTTGPLFEHACHEGNFGLYNTLVGARLEEKRESVKAEIVKYEASPGTALIRHVRRP